MPPSKKQNLYQDLKRRILTLELEPGADLDEIQCSKEYGLSRTPLRDVFRQLAGEGYIKIIGNKGASVSPMDHKTIRDFFQSAPLIYTATTRLATQNARFDQIQQLEEIQKKFKHAAMSDEVEDIVYYNNQFHHLIGNMADNQYLLVSLLRLLIDHARISQTFYQAHNAKKTGKLQKAIEQHDLMIKAIRTGDEELAARTTLAHWELSKSQAELFISPKDLPLDTLPEK